MTGDHPSPGHLAGGQQHGGPGGIQAELGEDRLRTTLTNNTYKRFRKIVSAWKKSQARSVLNHPFGFLAVDRRSHLIVTAGWVAGPEIWSEHPIN